MVKYILDFQWAHEMSMDTARFFFTAFFVIVLIFGLHFKREYVFSGAEDQKTWRDLRLWVIFIMALQVGIYWYF